MTCSKHHYSFCNSIFNGNLDQGKQPFFYVYFLNVFSCVLSNNLFCLKHSIQFILQKRDLVDTASCKNMANHNCWDSICSSIIQTYQFQDHTSHFTCPLSDNLSHKLNCLLRAFVHTYFYSDESRERTVQVTQQGLYFILAFMAVWVPPMFPLHLKGKIPLWYFMLLSCIFPLQGLVQNTWPIESNKCQDLVMGCLDWVQCCEF